jgi:MoxR-like ATPase
MKVKFSFNENIKALDVNLKKQKEEIKKELLMDPSYEEMLEMSSYLSDRIQRLLKKRRDRDPSFSQAELAKVRDEQDKIEQKLLKYQDLNPDEFEDEFKAEDVPMSGERLKLTLEPGTLDEIKSDIKRFLDRNTPVLLTGYSGFGKSQIAKQTALNIPSFFVPKKNFLDIRAGHMNVEDFKGLPTIDRSNPDYIRTTETLPDWIAEVLMRPNENFVLFFDEINHASEAVLNNLYGVVLERKLGRWTFNNVRIIAAGNTSNENESISMLSKPFLNRFEIISIDKAVQNNPDAWEQYIREGVSTKPEFKDFPMEILDALFAPTETIGNARDIEKLIFDWNKDIKEKQQFLTRSGSIDPAHYAKIQKIYEKKYRPKGSSRIKEVLNEVELAVKKLLKDSPEYADSKYRSYTVSDLLKNKMNPEIFMGAGVGLTDAGKQIIIEQFSKESPEILETVFAKLFGE